MSDNKTIQDIKDKLDIVEVIGRSIQLKKSGSNYKGLCPFHGEKSPSFMVSSQKQIWHCFGCGEGGDVIGFIKRYENLDFREALEASAEMAGIELPKFSGKPEVDKNLIETLSTINDLAAQYFQNSLREIHAQEATQYLTKRGLSHATLELWRVGFAPNSFDGLLKFLEAKKIEPKLSLQAGVLAKNEQNKIYDRFRNRITFPIFDVAGKIVGFTARVLPSADSDQAKYINSPETLAYNKSKVLFGLNFAKDAIRKSGCVVVMEGQLDVISAHQADFKNTVATSGTALTELHLRQLKRFTTQVVFAFDNDTAGQKALSRAVSLAMDLDFEIKIVKLEGAKDPDELIRKSAGLWGKLVKAASRAIDYYILEAKQDFLEKSLEQKQYVTEALLPLVRKIKSEVERDHYYQRLSQEFGIEKQALLGEKLSYEPSHHLTKTMGYEVINESLIDIAREKEILGGLIKFSEFLEFVRVEGLPEQLLSKELVTFFNLALRGQSLQGSQDTLVKEAMFMVESSLENLSNNDLALLRELKKSFYLFKLAKLKFYLQELTIAMKKAESEKKLEQAKQLGAKFAQLTNMRFEIETKLREA